MPVVLTHAQGIEAEPTIEVATESATTLAFWKSCNRLATCENAMLMRWLENQGYPGIPTRTRSRRNIKQRLWQRGQWGKGQKWIHENTKALKKLIRYPVIQQRILAELLWRMVEDKMDEQEKILAKATDLQDGTIVGVNRESDLIPPGLQWIANHPGLLVSKTDCMGRLENDVMQYEGYNPCPDQATRNQFELCRGHADMIHRLFEYKDKYHYERMRQARMRGRKVNDNYVLDDPLPEVDPKSQSTADEIDPDEFLKQLDEKYSDKEQTNGQADR